MILHKTMRNELMVQPGDKAKLHDRDTAHTKTDQLDADRRKATRDVAEHDLDLFKKELCESQELLYASSQYSVLVVLQALDAAGKDGTIKHVMSGVNPQGCSVTGFNAPTSEELAHDFLWRCAKALPARGQIGIFNRSYYEDVLVTRVHPDLLVRQHLPSGTEFGKKFWKQRFGDINAFERHLQRNGTKIVKVFLHLSRDEQKRRFLDRLDEPDKAWKFSSADLAERAHFDEYQQAYEAMLTATSTKWAPWFVVPADHKYLARTLVAGILARAIQDLHLQSPRVSDGERSALDLAKVSLLNE